MDVDGGGGGGGGGGRGRGSSRGRGLSARGRGRSARGRGRGGGRGAADGSVGDRGDGGGGDGGGGGGGGGGSDGRPPRAARRGRRRDVTADGVAMEVDGGRGRGGGRGRRPRGRGAAPADLRGGSVGGSAGDGDGGGGSSVGGSGGSAPLPSRRSRRGASPWRGASIRGGRGRREAGNAIPDGPGPPTAQLADMSSGEEGAPPAATDVQAPFMGGGWAASGGSDAGALSATAASSLPLLERMRLGSSSDEDSDGGGGPSPAVTVAATVPGAAAVGGLSSRDMRATAAGDYGGGPSLSDDDAAAAEQARRRAALPPVAYAQRGVGTEAAGAPAGGAGSLLSRMGGGSSSDDESGEVEGGGAPSRALVGVPAGSAAASTWWRRPAPPSAARGGASGETVPGIAAARRGAHPGGTPAAAAIVADARQERVLSVADQLDALLASPLLGAPAVPLSGLTSLLPARPSPTRRVLGEARPTFRVQWRGGMAAKAGSPPPKGEGEKEVQWSIVDESDTSDFATKVPHPVLSYPFVLDAFQKRAVSHIHAGESVFVAAHTSAGKTAIAEYALAQAAATGTRAVYTSPIKSLSNQKYKDLSDRFQSVGIVTGDVSIDDDAQTVIMTTEVLRSLLYKGADMVRDVSWVVFDEVQYVNDSERGVVWEEAIMLLPPHVRLVMLSATVPNAAEFAAWVGRTRKEVVHVVTTPYRPVPLQHSLLHADWSRAAGERGLPPLRRTRILRLHGAFDPVAYRSAVRMVTMPDDVHDGGGGGGRGGGLVGGRGSPLNVRDSATGGPDGRGGRVRGGGRGGGGGGGRGGGGGSTRDVSQGAWVALIRHLEAEELLPAVTFVFSKKKCDAAIRMLDCVDLLPEPAKKAEAARVFDAAVSTLRPVDRDLPQLVAVRESVRRGVAAHHAGLLPLVKEVVELLFGRGFVRALVATETFAVGVNYPARSVVFMALRKHDGESFRPLDGGEYTQMAGRAGRRGVDTVGHAMLYIPPGAEIASESSLRRVMTATPRQMASRFRLSYNMMLHVLRVDGLRIEELLRRSFSEAAGVATADSTAAALLRAHTLARSLDAALPAPPASPVAVAGASGAVADTAVAAAASVAGAVVAPSSAASPPGSVAEVDVRAYATGVAAAAAASAAAAAIRSKAWRALLCPGRVVVVLAEDGTLGVAAVLATAWPPRAAAGAASVPVLRLLRAIGMVPAVAATAGDGVVTTGDNHGNVDSGVTSPSPSTAVDDLAACGGAPPPVAAEATTADGAALPVVESLLADPDRAAELAARISTRWRRVPRGVATADGVLYEVLDRVPLPRLLHVSGTIAPAAVAAAATDRAAGGRPKAPVPARAAAAVDATDGRSRRRQEDAPLRPSRDDADGSAAAAAAAAAATAAAAAASLSGLCAAAARALLSLPIPDLLCLPSAADVADMGGDTETGLASTLGRGQPSVAAAVAAAAAARTARAAGTLRLHLRRGELAARLSAATTSAAAEAAVAPRLLAAYDARLAVLGRLGYISAPDGDGGGNGGGGGGDSNGDDSDDASAVTLKGRAACEVATVDSLLLTEVLLDNTLAAVGPAETAGLLSSLVCKQRGKTQRPSTRPPMTGKGVHATAPATAATSTPALTPTPAAAAVASPSDDAAAAVASPSDDAAASAPPAPAVDMTWSAAASKAAAQMEHIVLRLGSVQVACGVDPTLDAAAAPAAGLPPLRSRNGGGGRGRADGCRAGGGNGGGSGGAATASDAAAAFLASTVRWGLANVVLAWARGAPFGAVMAHSPAPEGDVVLCIKRLSELLREARDVARAVGNHELQAQLSEAGEVIRRDIVFQASLYLSPEGGGA